MAVEISAPADVGAPANVGEPATAEDVGAPATAEDDGAPADVGASADVGAPATVAAATPASPDAAVATSADSGNRRRDKRKVEKRLKLVEGGEGARALCDRDGRLLASGYERVCYGDHGPYLELTDAQLDAASDAFGQRFQLRCRGAFYDLYKSTGGASTELYHQTQTVATRSNPPRGRDSKNRDRPGGYANYRVGYWYVSPKLLVVDGRTMEKAPYVKPVGRGDALLRGAAAHEVFRLEPMKGVVARWGDRKYRFRRLGARALAADHGLPSAACVTVRAWRRDEGDRDVVLVTVEPPAEGDAAPASPLVAAARRMGLAHPALSSELRRASTSDVERATKWPRNYDALPLAPRAPAAALILVDARLLALDKLYIHVPRGFLAVVTPGALVKHIAATVVDVATADAGDDSDGTASPPVNGVPAAAACSHWAAAARASQLL